MALAKDYQTPSSSFYGNILETASPVQFPHISLYGFEDYDQQQDVDDLESPNSNKVMSNHQVISHSPPLSSSSSANSSNGFSTIHHASNYQPHEEAHSLINFKSGYGSFMHNNIGSFVSFQHEDQSADQTYQKLSHPSDYNNHLIWEGINTHNQHNQLKQVKNCSSNISILDEVNHLQSAGSDYQDASNEWLFTDANVVDPPQESGAQQTCFNKRPHMEENMQASKKQCTTNSSKKPEKSKTSSTTKDPQSIAAKNRRERISERLKILQDLVPNGSKVDLVTMLEKAIGYVKFLQLQVKVLATDEFWPAAGGKAPDISQVRQAIDAILTSSRSSEGTTSTSSK